MLRSIKAIELFETKNIDAIRHSNSLDTFWPGYHGMYQFPSVFLNQIFMHLLCKESVGIITTWAEGSCTKLTSYLRLYRGFLDEFVLAWAILDHKFK